MGISVFAAILISISVLIVGGLAIGLSIWWFDLCTKIKDPLASQYDDTKRESTNRV